LVGKGLSSRQIGLKLGVTNTTVQYWVKKLGLKFKLSKQRNGLRPPKYFCVGKRFGYLEVLEMIPSEKTLRKSYKVLCKCHNCGNSEYIGDIQNILRGSTTSCGCRIDQYLKNRGSNSSQFTGYKEITGTYWGHLKAKKCERKNPLKITIEQAYALYIKQNKLCALSGLPLVFGRSSYPRETTASLDRIDSTKGYTLDNIQWVHKNINLMKNIFKNTFFISVKRYPIYIL
jgi:hypothetical protein